MPYSERSGCVGAIGTMTQAMKGVHALRAASIKAEVVALSAGETKRGCAYGVAFPCEELSKARAMLRNAGVQVTQYLQRGNAP